ncbi:DUF1294 domain-containing protein [Brevibacillus daliensis]|uniref:DUF1294 domain-containing protein n=1 Tax=Brevibacillus daliensis TaxID=2892995 RepID=UPI001E4C48D1|nr:DUF1294 domain-containing protein [Brevibacillus daliensis]
MIPGQLHKHRKQRSFLLVASWLCIVTGVLLTNVWIFLLGMSIINLYSLVLMRKDKLLARTHRGFRIPENTFFLLSALGGATGTGLGMLWFRHKTKHASFCILVPVCLLLQYGLLLVYWPF